MERSPVRSLKWQVTSMAGAPVVAAVALAACGSGSSDSSDASGGSSGSGKSGGAGQAKAPAALCEQLTGILADGPDADADPLGSALSRIIPLQAVHSSKAAATAAVERLVAADQQFVQSRGADKAATFAIKRPSSALEKICPGVEQ